MADLLFKISPNIILGEYTISRIAQYIKPFGSKFMLILDPSLKNNGLKEKILTPLTERNVNFFIFDAIHDGANTKEIEQALDLARKSHVHGIIAAGGTKAMHTGFAVAALINETKSIYDFTDNALAAENSIPLICVPTTFRAPYALTTAVPVTDSRTHQAKMIRTQNSICKLILWDSTLAQTLEEKQRTALALESLCLTTEAYISQKASFFSDMFAEKAAELLGYGLNGAESLEISTPADHLLEQGGAMASLAAATSSVGIANLLALTLNARYRTPHSLAICAIFPYMLEDANSFKADKIEKIAHLFGIADNEIQKDQIVPTLIENIKSKLSAAGLPTHLKDLNLTMEQLAVASEDAGQLDIINTLPRSMNTDELFSLAKKAF
ncbi:MAG: iron-containing alcohol dehydrogenase [Treponema sp.]|nr:iron-containing alcohol dehydrogenase [Treponema sp.]